MKIRTSRKASSEMTSAEFPGAGVDEGRSVRGVDGIFDHGAKESARRRVQIYPKLRQDRTKAHSTQRSVSFIERDLYGRGDPRVFRVLPTTSSAQADHHPILINTHLQNNVQPATVAKAPRAFLKPVRWLWKISCFSSSRDETSLEDSISVRSVSPAPSPSFSASHSPSPSSPAVTAHAAGGSELAHTPTTQQTPSATPFPHANHAARSVPPSSEASKQTSFSRIESPVLQRPSGADPLVHREFSFRSEDPETVAVEQGLVARLVDSLHSTGSLSPKSSICMSHLASYEACSTGDQPARAELPLLTPQALHAPNSFRNNNPANTSNSASSDATDSTTTPSATGSAASPPRTTLPKSTTLPESTTSVDPPPLNSLSNLNSSRTLKGYHAPSEKAASISISALPTPLRPVLTSSSSAPSTNSSVATQHRSSSSHTPLPSNMPLSDRSEPFPAAASPSSPVLYTAHPSSSNGSSSASQPQTPSSSSVPTSRLNSRIVSTSTPCGTAQASESGDPAMPSSSSNPTTSSSVAARALSVHPGSADLSESAPVSVPALPVANTSGRKRLARVFQLVRGILRKSTSSPGVSCPSPAVPSVPALPSFGPGPGETNTSAPRVSRLSSASEHPATVSESRYARSDCDDVPGGSNENVSMGSSSSNPRAGFLHSGSHQRLSTSSSTPPQSEGEVQKRRDGVEAFQADNQALSDVPSRSPGAFICPPQERESLGTENQSSSSGPVEHSDDVIPPFNSEFRSYPSKEMSGHTTTEFTAPMHLSSAPVVEMLCLERNEAVAVNSHPAKVTAVDSLSLIEGARATGSGFSEDTFVQNGDDHRQDGREESSEDLGTDEDVSISSYLEMPDAGALEAALESVSSSQFIDSDASDYVQT